MPKLLTLRSATSRAYILVWYKLIVQASTLMLTTRRMTLALHREFKVPDRGFVLALT